MQDLCRAARYIRMSSNPTEGFLIKFFPHSLFGNVYFHVLFYYFFAYCLFVLIFCVFFFWLLYCIVFFQHNNENSRRFMSLTRRGCSFVIS